MKAFVTGVAAALVIAIIAALVLDQLPLGSDQVHQSQQGSVRL